MGQLEKRITRLEERLNPSCGPQTLEEMWEAFHKGEYGYSSLMGLVVDVLAHGRSVEHLRGKYPDLLLDDLARCFREFAEKQRVEESDKL